MCNVVGGLAAERASKNGVMLACSRAIRSIPGRESAVG
jgi:hypothetical protein